MVPPEKQQNCHSLSWLTQLAKAKLVVSSLALGTSHSFLFRVMWFYF